METLIVTDASNGLGLLDGKELRVLLVFQLVFTLKIYIIVITTSFHKRDMFAVISIVPDSDEFLFCCKQSTTAAVFILVFHPWCFFICANVAWYRSLIVTSVILFVSIISFGITQLTKVIVSNSYFGNIL